ncbi:MAG: oligosaccharide flippase family protein [Roseobacter sp.]
MLSAIQAKLSGDGMGARVIRGSALTFVGFGLSQLMRLGSNLILTRLLFPEAFGLMTIVTVLMTGIQMVSDIGLATCIVRSKRGDEPVFLNTAWTLQIIRHTLLAVICCIVAGPVAQFYGEPILHELMYGIGFSVFLMGLRSTRIATANKKILMGRLTLMDMGSQVLMIITMIVLALIWESVWALMIGMIVANLSKTVLSHLILPGHPNRLQFERAAVHEQFHFGKYLFVSSGLTFVIENGDRLLLSKFISLAYLGFYNIAFFFASVPMTLMGQLMNRVIFPLYSARPPAESAPNRRAISKTRFALTGGMFVLLFVLALMGQWLIDFLYTEEYRDSGPILVLLAVFLMPSLIIQSYPNLLLAVGKSNVYMYFQICRATLQITLLAVGMMKFGLIGAMGAQPLAALLIYPFLVWLIRPYRGADPLHDITFAVLAALCAAFVFWYSGDAFERVIEISVEGRAELAAQSPDTPLGE